MSILLLLFFLSPVFFIVGLIIAISSKEKRMVGLITMLVSAAIGLIGLSICSRMILIPGVGHHDEQEEKTEKGFILKYAPTTDSIFCDPEMIVPTDFLTGHLCFDTSGMALHYTNELGVWDSLRLETGVYIKYEDSLVGYFQEHWVIPYTSPEIHSIEKLDFEHAVRKKADTTNRFILRKNNCETYSYYSVETTNDYCGMVYSDVHSYEEIYKELSSLIKVIAPKMKNNHALQK